MHNIILILSHVCLIHITYSTMIILSPPSVISPRDQLGVCPTEEDSVWGIQWLAILPDATQSARCPGEGNATTFGLAYRRCRIGTNDQSQGVWDAVDASECESAASRAARMKVEHIYVLFCQTNPLNRCKDVEDKLIINRASACNSLSLPLCADQ